MVLTAELHGVTSKLHKSKYSVTASNLNLFFLLFLCMVLFCFHLLFISVWLLSYKYGFRRFALDDRIDVEHT